MPNNTRTAHHTPLTAFALVVALIALMACAPRPETDETPFYVADLFATPGKALATIELSPTPEPTATIPSVPSPTLAPTRALPTVIVLRQPTLPIGTPGPTPTPATTPTPTQEVTCPEPPMPFAPIWRNFEEVHRAMRCPLGTLETVQGVIQGYEHGVMFWRQSDRSIFVISDLAIQQGQTTDTWWRFDDTYQEGEPDSDPALQPPAGLIQPVRGFGKVWRNNAFIRDAMGWATTPEIPLDSQWMWFEGGWMMAGIDGNPIWALVPFDSSPYSTGLHYGPLPR